MNIAMVSHYFAEHKGGVEVTVQNLAGELGRRGHKIQWAAFGEQGLERPILRGVEYLALGGSNIAERVGGLPFPVVGPAGCLAIYRAVRRADLVHVHDCVYPACIVASLAALVLRRPLIVTQQIGLIPYRNPILRVILSALYRSIGWFVMRTASRAVFVSPAVRDYFSGIVRLRSEPRLIRNGVDPSVFRPAAAAERKTIRQELGLGEGEPCALFVGRFTEKKGIELLRGVCSVTKSVRFLFAGWGAVEPDKWGLQNVKVIHSPEHSELRRLYCAADLLLLPSVGEGAPLVLLEGMACNLPCVVSSDAGAALAEEAPLLIPVERNERAICDCLSGLFQSGGLERAREAIGGFDKSRWSWEHIATQYEELFEEALRGRGLK